MATPTRKRKAISLETKYEIIQCLEMGNDPKKDVAAAPVLHTDVWFLYRGG
jgi:hypothetical protein